MHRFICMVVLVSVHRCAGLEISGSSRYSRPAELLASGTYAAPNASCSEFSPFVAMKFNTPCECLSSPSSVCKAYANVATASQCFVAAAAVCDEDCRGCPPLSAPSHISKFNALCVVSLLVPGLFVAILVALSCFCRSNPRKTSFLKQAVTVEGTPSAARTSHAVLADGSFGQVNASAVHGSAYFRGSACTADLTSGGTAPVPGISRVDADSTSKSPASPPALYASTSAFDSPHDQRASGFDADTEQLPVIPSYLHVSPHTNSIQHVPNAASAAGLSGTPNPSVWPLPVTTIVETTESPNQSDPMVRDVSRAASPGPPCPWGYPYGLSPSDAVISVEPFKGRDPRHGLRRILVKSLSPTVPSVVRQLVEGGIVLYLEQLHLFQPVEGLDRMNANTRMSMPELSQYVTAVVSANALICFDVDGSIVFSMCLSHLAGVLASPSVRDALPANVVAIASEMPYLRPDFDRSTLGASLHLTFVCPYVPGFWATLSSTPSMPCAQRHGHAILLGSSVATNLSRLLSILTVLVLRGRGFVNPWITFVPWARRPSSRCRATTSGIDKFSSTEASIGDAIPTWALYVEDSLPIRITDELGPTHPVVTWSRGPVECPMLWSPEGAIRQAVRGHLREFAVLPLDPPILIKAVVEADFETFVNILHSPFAAADASEITPNLALIYARLIPPEAEIHCEALFPISDKILFSPSGGIGSGDQQSLRLLIEAIGNIAKSLDMFPIPTSAPTMETLSRASRKVEGADKQFVAPASTLDLAAWWNKCNSYRSVADDEIGAPHFGKNVQVRRVEFPRRPLDASG